MQVLVGRSVSPGYADGTAVLLDNTRAFEIPKYEIDHAQISDEVSRFHEALEWSCRDLRQLEGRVPTELGDAQSSIFSAHLSLLQDQQFVERIRQRIRDRLVNVEQALDTEIADLTKLLATLENEYLRERAQDIRDVGTRLLRQLTGETVSWSMELPAGAVIVAKELLPSETIDLDRKNVVAIVTEEGGENSHAAILARAIGIPAVSGVAHATSKIAAGTRLLVDGQAGRVTLAPSDDATSTFRLSRKRYDDDTAAAVESEELDCVTQDGSFITLLGNLNRPHETKLIGRHHLRGVGLFRTEFLYLDSTTRPGYRRQLRIYRSVFRALGDYPIVVRTLDLGGDKIPAFLDGQREDNRLLGSRGLRFSLAERELFETQIRALLVAMGDHDVRIMFPMVLGADDLRQGIECVERIAAEIGVGKLPKMGAMIETPSSLFSLTEILKLADFVSIGTNALTQFMLAADRTAVELAEEYSVLHPSVLRAIELVAKSGSVAGRKVCVCGEAAGEPATAALLVGLGIRQLSMSPIRAARVGSLLRHSYLDQLQQLAQEALHAGSTNQIRELLSDLDAQKAGTGSA